MPAAPSPYTFGPEGRPVEDLRDYGKPSQMASILPYQPVAARDKNGNRLYFTADGRMSCQVSPDGKVQFSLGSASIERDANGNLLSKTELIQGSNKSETRNEKGELLTYRVMAFGGKTAQEFDANGNLLKTYAYDTYGKNTQWVLDELSLTKTVFNEQGQPAYDQNFEGIIVAKYFNDDKNRLSYKIDQYGNKTHFDDKGNLTYTENSSGQKLAQYSYKIDSEGRYVLDKMEDLTPGVYAGDITYFENGKAVKTVSRYGGVAKEFHYDGSTLRYTFDTRTNEVTWYDINGKATHASFDGNMTNQWLYYKSRLVGYYNNDSKTVTLFQYERQDQSAKMFAAADIPSAEEIESYYEQNGLMTDIGATTSSSQNTVMQSGKLLMKYTKGVVGLMVTEKIATSSAKKIGSFALQSESQNGSSTPAVKTGLLEGKYNYVNGRLASIVARNATDTSGWVTQIFVGEVTSGQDRTSITVSGNQTGNTELAAELWDSITNNGKNISDIASDNGELAAFAKTVKSLSINSSTLGALNDQQLVNLFGWNRTGAGTSYCIDDVRKRAANAGRDGTMIVTFGYDDTGIQIYAAAVTAADSSSMVVGGIQPNGMLDITSQDAYASVTSADGKDFALIASASQSPSAPDTPSEQWNSAEAAAAGVQNINGTIRLYASNGNILAEKNTLAGEKTFYNAFGKPAETYSANGQLTQAFYYGGDGQLAAAKQLDSASHYVTVFYVGWGVPGLDQTAITVEGDQTANIEQVSKLFKEVAAGASIADIPAENGFLSTFVKTIKSISVAPAMISKMTDAQLCNLFGWDLSAPKTAECLSDARTRAQNAGINGTFTITYGFNKNSEGQSGDHLYAASLQAKTGSDLLVYGNANNDTHLDLTSDTAHDSVVAPGFRNSTTAPALSAAMEEAVMSSGFSLMQSLANFISSLGGSL